MLKRTTAATSFVVASLLLVGCSGSEGEASVGPSTTKEADAPETADAEDRPSLHSKEWQQRLDEIALAYGIEDPPRVAPIRVVGEDYVEAIDACMSDAGFPIDESGAINVPEDQAEAYALVVYTCEAQYPIDSRYLQPLTEEQYKTIHAYLVSEAVPCLADLGYAVPVPPSEATYVATVDGPDAYTTSGELYKLGLDTAEVEAAIADCPEIPPVEDLYSDR